MLLLIQNLIYICKTLFILSYMKSYFLAFFLGLFLILQSCESKKSYISKFDEFVSETSTNYKNFSETEWERKLWILVRDAYSAEIRKNPKFVAPDWVTIMDCEKELEESGVVRTYRQFGKVIKN